MEEAKSIYLAGGCFWGMQAYFDQIEGVVSTKTGYANGTKENPTYEMVCNQNSGYAETIQILYDDKIVSLSFLLEMYFKVIDPISVDRQGNDIGNQYRTGIYYIDSNDIKVIQSACDQLQKTYEKPLAIEITSLICFYPAEDYHQKYLDKHPNGYCHIPANVINEAKYAKESRYTKPTQDILRTTLNPIQYAVTQENETEKPFQNEYWNHHEKGIYVDITTGEPLFLSNDKFDSSCGWPSFTKPVQGETVNEVEDCTHGMKRTEIRSQVGDAHLGHVFTDGPIQSGGLRYCINSASLRFISYEDMEKEGYASYIKLLD